MLGTLSVLLGFAAWASLAVGLLRGGLNADALGKTLAQGATVFAVIGACAGVIAVLRRPTRIRNWIGLVACVVWLGLFTGALGLIVP